MDRDIDLLRLEMETLWERDAYGCLGPHPLVAVAVAQDGLAVRYGSEVSDETRRSIEDGGSMTLERIRASLASLGPVRMSGGPSYVFPDEPLDLNPPTLDILTSDERVPSALRAARPEAWWEAEEWEDLLAGRLGPWAIGMAESRVAALCHTPIGSDVAAEAGVWTHPETRGRGYAGIVTAAWSRVAKRRLDTLFYSTGVDNVASQSVARKLGLRAIGQIWSFWAGDPLVEDKVPGISSC